MRERNRSGRGGRRRSGGDAEADLFAKQLSEVVQQAFTAAGGEAGGVEATVPPEASVEARVDLPTMDAPDGPVEVVVVQDAELEAIGEDDVAAKVEQRVESLPARMLNEFVYCPRLFYYEHVEGVLVESADTVKGAAVRDAAKIVRSYVEDYHEKLEQDYLFPRFINANRMKDLVQVLLQQHLGGRNLTDAAMHMAVQGAVKDREDRRKLADALGSFVHMYHAHEAREDTVLFPAFRTLVSAHEYAALREDFDKRERELFGGDSFGAMVERVAAIEKQLGIDDLAKFTRGF